MPASYFTDMEKTNGIGDERALQLALELTMLGLEPLGGVTEPDPTSDLTAFVNPLSNPMDEVRSKKSQNMTECVPVPSSEHVAEIVGRQGKFNCCFNYHQHDCLKNTATKSVLRLETGRKYK